ncbi:MAG: 50S ribosomal protein L11 methyltransferase [Firmicutes bacterium]|nr:50S ribosomal protein L11 methyltransferase [Bacillota bacterium]
MADGAWTRITVTTSLEAVEAVIGLLMNAGVGGVEISDPRIWEEEATAPDHYGELYPEVVPVPSDAFVEVIAYLAGDCRDCEIISAIQRQVPALMEAGLNPGPARVDTTLVADSDWAHGWKDFYHTQRVGQRIVIRPSWEVYVPHDDDVVLAIDPGMAFGTGEHKTTRLCLVQLERLMRPQLIVYDIGCGSGILSLAAAKLGASRVEACDLDPVAVQVAKENVADNGLQGVISIHKGPIDVLDGKADLIVANIITDVIIDILPAVARRLVPGGYFVAGGIIGECKDEVLAAHANADLAVVAEELDDDWLCLVSTI